MAGRPSSKAVRIGTAIASLLAAALLVAACGARGGASGQAAGRAGPVRATADRPSAASRLEVLRESGSSRGFARAIGIPRFEFPRDHGPHPRFRHEWWYFTGHLQGADGERFGFEVTFFRIALAPPPIEGTPGTAASRWRARQFYVAHFAITDIRRRTFHATQRFARDALGLAGAQAAPFRVWLGGWSVAQADGAGEWLLRVSDAAYGLTLRLRPLSEPIPNGDRGLSVKSDEPGAASDYYSIPRLETRGRLVRAGRPIDVSGTAWLDREWGSGSLGPRQRGWDWFALQLSDGSALMFYALRDAGAARDSHSAGTWVDASGKPRALASGDVAIEVLGTWTSADGTRYPARWRVRIASLGLDVIATPVLADQELDTAPRYWEGDVDVAGVRGDRAVAGQGYVELVGYDRR